MAVLKRLPNTRECQVVVKNRASTSFSRKEVLAICQLYEASLRNGPGEMRDLCTSPHLKSFMVKMFGMRKRMK